MQLGGPHAWPAVRERGGRGVRCIGQSHAPCRDVVNEAVDEIDKGDALEPVVDFLRVRARPTPDSRGRKSAACMQQRREIGGTRQAAGMRVHVRRPGLECHRTHPPPFTPP